jgi:hypothetical protein
MLSYLQKFNSLPKDIKDAVASPEAAARIVQIGTTYKIDLAALVMKVMVKEVPLDGLSAFIVNQYNLPAEQASKLEKDLRKSIFSPVIDYLLGASAGPKLVFSETDEKEVKQTTVPASTLDYDAMIEAALSRVVAKSHIDFDPLTGGKFRQVIKTFLRGTRDKAMTLEALTKALELGGVALSRDAAERALGVAEAEMRLFGKPAPRPSVKIPVPEDSAISASPFKKIVNESDYDLASALKDKPKLETPVKQEPITDPAHELAPLVPKVVNDIKAPEPARKIIKQAVAAKAMDKAALKTIVNFKTSASGKVRMDDIRFTPQVLSPIDELRYMTIKTFRRLHPDPTKATEKIKEKLEFLGQSEYGKKIEGIVAWQESPLSKLYLSLCRRALEEGKPVVDILKAELKSQPESLKPEELSAIIALNRSLKF